MSANDLLLATLGSVIGLLLALFIQPVLQEKTQGLRPFGWAVLDAEEEYACRLLGFGDAQGWCPLEPKNGD